jgi:hypothetical protein
LLSMSKGRFCLSSSSSLIFELIRSSKSDILPSIGGLYKLSALQQAKASPLGAGMRRKFLKIDASTVRPPAGGG